MNKIRVLVVDDSALMCSFLREMLSRDSQIEVVDTAADAIIAREKIKRLDPDVITLDVEMPNMSGLDFLEKLMRLRPMPVIMVSSLTSRDANETLRALALGAVDVMAKPVAGTPEEWDVLATELIEKVKVAAAARVQSYWYRVPIMNDRLPSRAPAPPLDRVIAIGASTGGVQALQTVLYALPEDCPPILIAQHMPPNFTRSFAKRLAQHCAIKVAEATDGLEVLPGHAYLAPGDHHLILERRTAGYVCRLKAGPEYNGHMPAIDLLFQSVASVASSTGMGLLLTGMGKDGAQGLLQIHDAGGVTAVQDEATCLIYGMPKAAVALGAAQHELPIEEMASFILESRARLKHRVQRERLQA
jgi:two-component system, chemotaxis family, protein-glutamate methylesterase/glutaminase